MWLCSLAITSTGRVGLWLYGFCVLFVCFVCFLCPGAPEGSTGSGSDFKASKKMGPQFKVSSDRLGKAGNRTCDPWFTRHRLIPYTTAASLRLTFCGKPSDLMVNNLLLSLDKIDIKKGSYHYLPNSVF